MLRVQNKYPKQRQWQRTHSLMTVIISVSKDVLSRGLRVFIVGINGATNVAHVLDCGGTSGDMPWRDKDEDFLNWAYRAMRYAQAKHYSGNRFKRSLNK